MLVDLGPVRVEQVHVACVVRAQLVCSWLGAVVAPNPPECLS